MTSETISEAEQDDLLSRAFAALKQFRQRDQEAFFTVLGDEAADVLVVLVGVLDGWLQEQAGDDWITEQIDGFLDHRRDRTM